MAKMGKLFAQAALPKNFIVALDEPEQCQSYGDRWYEAAEELYQNQDPQADTPKLYLNDIYWSFGINSMRKNFRN